jgi:4-amino-4-deoxy-L-arabinose transferase-like glycosyltransferase
VSLIVNLLDRGYGELLRVLSFDQIAPVGFLWIEKLLSQMLGASEYSLRLFPLLAGINALPLVWIAGRRLAGPWPAVLAVALVRLFSRRAALLGRSQTYGVELFVTAGLLALSAYWPKEQLTARRAGLLTLAGLAATSLSNPAIYVLAGFGLLPAVRALERRVPAAEWMLLRATGAKGQRKNNCPYRIGSQSLASALGAAAPKQTIATTGL